MIADAGDLTVLRSLAAFAYGKWDVAWPESVPEDQRPTLDDERDFGYAAKLRNEPGRMGRRFVRADVSIEAAEYSTAGEIIAYSGFSDVEDVLDDAAARTEGDAFPEASISREGLGGLRPRTDFDVGDLVPLLKWGKTLVAPVRSIEDVVEQGRVVDWNVLVGGELVADSVARETQIRALTRDMEAERRELAEVRTAARVAQATADTAVEDARRLTESLSGPDATTATVFEQLEQLTDDLEGQGLPALEGLLPNYIALNTRLWEQQDEINALQAEINETASEDREQIRALVGELQRSQSRELLRPVTSSDPRWSVDGETITALGEWTGTVITFGSKATKRTDSNEGGEIEIRDWYPVYKTRPVPQADGSRTYDYAEAAFYLMSEGEQKTLTRAGGMVDADRGALLHLAEFDFVAETTIEDLYLSYVVWLDAADRGTRYRIEVQVNGVTRYYYESSKIGPLGPLGNGHRQMVMEKSGISLAKGDVVTFHYLTEGEEASQRRLRSSEVHMSWIQPAEEGS
ncbi:hypothetical protein ACXM2N_03545 [Corynebacterium sp. ZY180755]